MIKSKAQNDKGFTLLFAVLLSSLVLVVGASIITIALKQINLSGTARDSQYAFYASNSGLECAMYWDLVGIAGQPDIFATSTASDRDYTDDTRSTVSCAGASLIDSEVSNAENDCTNGNIDEDTGWCIDADSDSATSKFRIQLDGVPYCADVFVTKQISDGNSITIIESKGYNVCDNEFRRVERGLRIRY